MGFFASQWIVLIVGFLIHLSFDRSPARRTRARVYELASLWLLVGVGVGNILAGYGHIGPNSDQTAIDIGFTQSMFQWEIGWADIALGVLGVLCARKAHRGQWTNATLTALTVSFFGDGIGHVIEWLGHGNLAPDNVWAIPTCFLVPTLSALFVYLARRDGTFSPRSTPQVATGQETGPARLR
jgi:uncharacterized protein DUF6790